MLRSVEDMVAYVREKAGSASRDTELAALAAHGVKSYTDLKEQVLDKYFSSVPLYVPYAVYALSAVAYGHVLFASGGWAMVCFYDGGQFDYIDEVITPCGNRIQFFWEAADEQDPWYSVGMHWRPDGDES